MKKIIKALLVVMVIALAITAFTACEIPGLTPDVPDQPAGCEHTGGEATCTEKGVCELCGEEYLDALGHDPKTIAAVDSTCTEAGHTSGVACGRCDVVLEPTDEIAALGHTEVVDAAVDATCAAPGKTEGKHCSVCNEVLVAQNDVPQIAHTLTFVTTIPTADAPGNTVASCSVCGFTETTDLVNVMTEGTYVLEGSALDGIEKNSLADGQVVVVNNVFSCHLSYKYATNGAQKKTFADDYFGEYRLNYGGKTEFKADGLIKNGIEFTVAGNATVTVWWVEGGDDHRQIGIYDMAGNLLQKTDEQSLAKNDPCISTFTVSAGTYVLGNVGNTNYHFKIEVVVAAEEEGWDGTTVDTSWLNDAEGTEADPYVLMDGADLAGLASLVNVDSNSFAGKYIVLGADINLGNKAWTPIGQTGAGQFGGTFDGKGYTISNLSIDTTAETGVHYSTGLFGWLNHATVKNLNVDGATIKGNHNVGVIAGYMETSGCTISGCNVTGATIEAHHVNDDICGDKVGVIVGHAGNSGVLVENCTVAESSVVAGRDAGQVVGAALTANVVGCTATNVTVEASGDCTGANINNDIIGRNLG